MNTTMKMLGTWLALQAACCTFSYAQKATGIEIWLTTHDGSVLFARQTAQPRFTTAKNSNPTIEVDPGHSYQQMDGFGYTLTGGSAQLIHHMSAAARKALLKELFTTEGNGIGISYIRISIGASDMNDHVFSYDDLPDGQTDPKLAKFSLGPDEADLIPVLKEILAIQPRLKILGSPWSAPVWMKDNNDTKGGSLKPQYQQAYASYLVKYLQTMQTQGIHLDALTIQNEPLHPGNNPSMFMPATQQADFIKNNLGPAFKAAHIRTKILIYDHNLDHIDYPLTVLNDPGAFPYVDGSAFHLYGGTIEEMSKVHEAHPDKNVYFTEEWVSAKDGSIAANLDWHMKNLMIGAPRNWSKTVLEWNLAADPNQNPHTDRGGCNICLGAITIDGDKVSRNPAYFIIAHASKFVRPGSTRIASTVPGDLLNVAYRTPTGKTVVLVLNHGSAEQTFNISYQGKAFIATLASGSAATYVW